MAHTIGPASTIGPSGFSLNSNSVTMPKLPPPPRTPQKSSVFSSSLALTSSPRAVTSFTERSWSIVRPYFRCSHPIPPPSVSPATPVCVTIPAGTASPAAWVAASISPSSTPGAALTVCASGSISTLFIGLRSITRPSSQVDMPGKLWPPPRTAAWRPVRRASSNAALTSSTPMQRAISDGKRSTDPFHTARCSS